MFKQNLSLLSLAYVKLHPGSFQVTLRCLHFMYRRTIWESVVFLLCVSPPHSTNITTWTFLIVDHSAARAQGRTISSFVTDVTLLLISGLDVLKEAINKKFSNSKDIFIFG